MRVINNKRLCSNFRRQHMRYNANAQLGYFGKNCPDPATSLSYWRRRFGSTKCYLNSYFIPFAKGGYRNGGRFTPGRICHILHKRNASKCNDDKRKC